MHYMVLVKAVNKRREFTICGRAANGEEQAQLYKQQYEADFADMPGYFVVIQERHERTKVHRTNIG